MGNVKNKTSSSGSLWENIILSVRAKTMNAHDKLVLNGAVLPAFGLLEASLLPASQDTKSRGTSGFDPSVSDSIRLLFTAKGPCTVQFRA